MLTMTAWSILQRRVLLMAAGLLIAFAVAACNQPVPPAAAPAQTVVEHDKMLVIGGACHDCLPAIKNHVPDPIPPASAPPT